MDQIPAQILGDKNDYNTREQKKKNLHMRPVQAILFVIIEIENGSAPWALIHRETNEIPTLC
jgi:hypothetical protein